MPRLAFMTLSKPITISFTPTMHLVSTVVFEDNALSALTTFFLYNIFLNIFSSLLKRLTCALFSTINCIPTFKYLKFKFFYDLCHNIRFI
ncbi:hypothetical protein AAJ76_3500011554 [Vairimorpha ceranae]|uniref:Uncharacterized protein n=1 Tax=Vairimorpha ceranae TaxID=40302 RepID=A0A0F9WE10_9MICR|nr:hypothetical protein AAJ76_3500011554 [Vairimorpha ceranae]KKO75025.1 hypothetical protein AAJ76_3500011554 [Vairimorpha ceranae]